MSPYLLGSIRLNPNLNPMHYPLLHNQTLVYGHATLDLHLIHHLQETVLIKKMNSNSPTLPLHNFMSSNNFHPESLEKRVKEIALDQYQRLVLIFSNSIAVELLKRGWFCLN